MADPAQDWTKEFEPLEQARENAPPDDQAIMQGATKRLQERHTKDGVLDVGAFQRAARMQLRGINQATDSDFQPMPQLSSLEEAGSLPPGTNFLGPDGAKRVVPYKAESVEAINDVPDGAHFIGPDGNLRQKPKFEPIDVTSEYLYDISHSDKGRRKALERAYPGKVRDDPSGGFYVEDEGGVLRKPGRGAARTGGGFAAAAAPATMSTAGAIGGGMLGGRAGILTGALGGGLGGYAGSKTNDIVASLAGVYDPEGAEEGALKEGALGAGGALLGPAIAGTGKLIKSGIEKGKEFFPSLANKALGTDPAKLKLAREMAERGAKPGEGPIGQFFEEPGTMVPPSQVFPEAPALHNIVEVKEPALHTQKPLRKSAEENYERGVGEMLEGLGVGKPMNRAEIDKSFGELVKAQEAGDAAKVAELEKKIADASTRSATHPTAGVSVEEAGKRLLESKRAASAASDQRLQELLELRKADAERRAAVSGGANAARTAELKTAQEAAQRDAQSLLDIGFQDIDRQSQDVLRVAHAGHNTGNLWRSIAEQIEAYRAGFQARARTMYNTADELSGATLNRDTGQFVGGAVVDTSRLSRQADAFLRELPEGFEAQNPAIVRRIRDLAGEADGEGSWIREPAVTTWSQLRDLRTQLRQSVNWQNLTPNVREGTYKHFNNRVNEILTAPRAVTNAVPTTGNAIEDRVIQTAIDLRGGQLNGRVLLSDLRTALPNVPKEELDAVLIRLHRNRAGQLIRLDNPAERSAGVELARIDLAGEPHHVLWMRRDPRSIPTGASEQNSLNEAVAALRNADAFYRENIRVLEDKQLQTLANGMKSGMQADPRLLLKTIMKEGRSETAQQIRGIVGENTWNALRAADVQDMLASSRNLLGEIDGRTFAREVSKRQKQGLLDTLHGPNARQLTEQATRIEQLAGRLPIRAQPGDTATDVIMRAHAAAEAAKESAKDPIRALKQEIGQIVKSHKAEMAAMQEADPLKFMLDPTVGAHQAVDKILSHPDMLVAASKAFPGGENSPEFQLIRQVYAERFLRGDMYGLSDKLADKALTPEIQSLMFPGVTIKQMHMLAKEMDLLKSKASGQFGNSLMGTNIQEHPIGAAAGLGIFSPLAAPAKVIPGANMGARMLLGEYYALVRKVMTSPTTLRWLEKGLTSPDPAGRAAAREELRKIMQQGQAAGAGIGAEMGSTMPQEGGNE
jgi:hypothetical protein